MFARAVECYCVLSGAHTELNLQQPRGDSQGRRRRMLEAGVSMTHRARGLDGSHSLGAKAGCPEPRT